MDLRPVLGGFIRPFGTAWFIIEFLKGNGPEDSKRIAPDIGAPMTDIHFEYKSALHRAHARHAAEMEEERRIKKGGPPLLKKNTLSDYNTSSAASHINYTRCDMRASLDTLVT